MRLHRHCFCGVVTWNPKGVCRGCISKLSIALEKPLETGELVWEEPANRDEAPKSVRKAS